MAYEGQLIILIVTCLQFSPHSHCGLKMMSEVSDFIPPTSHFSLQNSTKPLSYNSNLQESRNYSREQLRSSSKRRRQDPCSVSRYIGIRAGCRCLR